jgi:two-component system sensor histidine kinase AtoS
VTAFLLAGLLLLTGLAGCLGLTVEDYFGFEYLPLVLFLAVLAAALLFWEQQYLAHVTGRSWGPVPYVAVSSLLLAVIPHLYPGTPKLVVVVPGIVCALTCPTRVSLMLAAGVTVLLLGGDLLLPAAERRMVLQTDLVLGGVLLLTAGVIGSISHKKRAVMDMLVRDRNFLHQLFHALPVGVLALDREKRVTLINGVAREIFGLDGQDVVGRMIDQLTGFPAELILPLCHKAPVHGVELTLTAKRRVVVGDVSPLGAPGDGWLLLFKDVTERKYIERQLARSSRLALIGEMAAGMAHEIRNPLTVIRGFAQLLRGRGGRDVAECATVIMEEADRINRLLEDFLLLARPMRSVIRELNLADLLRSLCKSLEVEARKAGVRLQLRIHSPLPAVPGDARQLRQAFGNVITNAIQATPAGGLVTVSANPSADRRYLEVTVADTGKGIPAELADRVFDPFFTTKEDGTGLGLAIANRVVHDHHGELKLESQPDRGTVLRVRLPVRAGSTETARTPRAPDGKAGG